MLTLDGTSTTTTAGNGAYSFSGVSVGRHVVVETDPAGFVSTTSNRVAVSVPASGAGTANFGDQQQGTINGKVFNDLNGNGAQDAGEPGIGGVTLTLDGATTTRTAGNGAYSFTGVNVGSHRVRETDPSGYASTTSNRRTVSVAASGSATANFGDQALQTIVGVVFEDKDGDGTQDNNEPGIGGVEVRLLQGGTEIATTTTSPRGAFQFVDVPAGSYVVQQVIPSGYTVITTLSSRYTLQQEQDKPVEMTEDGAASATFSMNLSGSISGVVFNDLNGNGGMDPGEKGIGGAAISLSGAATLTETTAGDGSYTFSGLAGGTYVAAQADIDGFITTQSEVTVSIATNGAAVANFANQSAGTVSGKVFNDEDWDKEQDEGELGIGGVTVILQTSGGTLVATATTSGDGTYIFDNVTDGTYRVIETDPEGFSSTSPNSVEITLSSGQPSATANFGDRVGAVHLIYMPIIFKS